MKRILPLLAALCCLVACNNQNTPEPTQEVTFNISAFQQSAPMGMPAKVPIYDEAEGGTELTDIYVFDGGIEVLHQTSDMDEFGSFTLNLTHGNHNLSFIATRATGISIESGVMTMDAVRPTFGHTLSLNVSEATKAQSVTLDRISGQMSITIKDAFPKDADEIEFIINPRYSELNVATLCAINGKEVAQRVSCTSKVGKKDQTYTFALLAPSLTDEYLADVTINVYNATGGVIHTVSISDVRLASNTKTLLSGEVFRGTDATLFIDHAWNADIVGNF